MAVLSLHNVSGYWKVTIKQLPSCFSKKKRLISICLEVAFQRDMLSEQIVFRI